MLMPSGPVTSRITMETSVLPLMIVLLSLQRTWAALQVLCRWLSVVARKRILIHPPLKVEWLAFPHQLCSNYKMATAHKCHHFKSSRNLLVTAEDNILVLRVEYLITKAQRPNKLNQIVSNTEKTCARFVYFFSCCD